MQVVECNSTRIVGGDLINWQLHGGPQCGQARRDHPMANASHDSHNRERNHLGRSRQPGLISIDEERRDQEKQSDLKTTLIDNAQQPRYH